MKQLFTRTLAFGIGVAATLLLLEGLLRVLPVFGGVYAAEPREDWPLHTLIPNREYTYSTGWNLQNIHHGRTNNFGYPAPNDYHPGHGDIAVFGDSYIESTMNDPRDSLSGSLNDYLEPDLEVLAFGMSGAEMPDYLGMSALVSERFSPKWGVFRIGVDDFTNGFDAKPGFFVWDASRSPPIRLLPDVRGSRIGKVARTLGLVRYFRGNVPFTMDRLVQLHRADHVAGKTSCREGILSTQDEALLAAYAQELPRALKVPAGHVILVFDSDRRRIYAGSRPEQQPCHTRAALANQRLMQLAREAGMHVIDTEPLFRRHFEAGLGPLDRAPLDGHWNPAAHRLVAEEVARVVNP